MPKSGSGTITIHLPDVLKVYINGVDYTPHVTNFEFVEQKNLVGEFSVEMVAVTPSDRDTVKRGNDVQLRLGNKLIFKGLIQRPEYKTDQFCTVRGFGATETLMKSISAKQTSSSDSVSSDGRISYGFDTTSGVSTRTIVDEQISGVPNVYIGTNSYLGHLTVRAEYDNVLSFLDGLVGTMSGVWWSSYGDFPYNTNFYNVSSMRSDSTASKKTFVMTGSQANANTADREVDEEELWTSVIALGQGDSDSQLQSRVYHATDNFTFLISGCSTTDVILYVEDTTGFEEKTKKVFEDWSTGDGYTLPAKWTDTSGVPFRPKVQSDVVLENGTKSLELKSAAPEDCYATAEMEPGIRYTAYMLNGGATVTNNRITYFDENMVSGISCGITYYGFSVNYPSTRGIGGKYYTDVFANTNTWYQYCVEYEQGSKEFTFSILSGVNYIINETFKDVSPFNIKYIDLRVKADPFFPNYYYYIDDINVEKPGLFVGQERIVYSGITATSFLNCKRAFSNGRISKQKYLKAYPHSKGVAVFDASYTETSTDGNSKIDTYGLKQKTLVDKRIVSQDALDLLATNTLVEHYEPIERIEVVPSDLYDCLKNLNVDDRVTIDDNDSGISGVYAIVGQKVSMKEGYEELTYECQNIRPTFTQDLRAVQADTKATSSYGQGSTAIYNLRGSAAASTPVDIKVYLPKDVKGITRAEVTSKITAGDTYTLEYGLMSGVIGTVSTGIASGVIINLTDWLASGITLSQGNWMLARLTPAGSGAIDDAELFAKVFVEGTTNA